MSFSYLSIMNNTTLDTYADIDVLIWSDIDKAVKIFTNLVKVKNQKTITFSDLLLSLA